MCSYKLRILISIDIYSSLFSPQVRKLMLRTVKILSVVYWLSQVVITIPPVGGLKNRKLFYHIFGDWTSKIKVLVAYVRCFLACRQIPSHRVLTLPSLFQGKREGGGEGMRERERKIWIYFYKDTNPIRLGPTYLYDLI